MNQSIYVSRPTTPAGPDRPNTAITIRIPRLNWQVIALALIALIAAFQTVQLVWLKDSVTARATTASTTAPTTGSTASSGLQSQVGGC